jgi:hypothetical protein
VRFGKKGNFLASDIAFDVPALTSDERITVELRLGIPPGGKPASESGSHFSFGLVPALSYSVKQKQIALVIPT